MRKLVLGRHVAIRDANSSSPSLSVYNLTPDPKHVPHLPEETGRVGNDPPLELQRSSCLFPLKEVVQDGL